MSQKNKENCIYQVSTLKIFSQGNYDGIITLDELKLHGDTGLGCFDGIDGEMIIFDSIVYQATEEGNINIMNDDDTTSLAMIIPFDETIKIENISAADFDDLTEKLNKKIEKFNENNFYAAIIDCEISDVTIRIVTKQEKPYEELKKVIKNKGKHYTFENQKGTFIGLYFPEYMDEINTTGWHFHFLSKEKTKGGHVVKFSNMTNAFCKIEEIHQFKMILPH